MLITLSVLAVTRPPQSPTTQTSEATWKIIQTTLKMIQIDNSIVAWVGIELHSLQVRTQDLRYKTYSLMKRISMRTHKSLTILRKDQRQTDKCHLKLLIITHFLHFMSRPQAKGNKIII